MSITARIIVAAHKPYPMPQSELYHPVQVGSAGKESIGFARDDQGNNISRLNPWYCELTGIYWAWKNLLPKLLEQNGGEKNSLFIGTAHYRRHFCLRRHSAQTPDAAGTPAPGSSASLKLQAQLPEKENEKSAQNTATKKAATGLDNILSYNELACLVEKHAIILPRKRHYYIETLRSHFIHAHGSAELDLLRKTVAGHCREYLNAFDTVMRRRSLHLYNMFIMRADLFEDYCAWLFPLLEKTAAAIAQAGMEASPRIYGFMSERLLDVWLEAGKHHYTEINCLMQEKVNWPRKIAAFLSRKLKGGK